MEEKPQKKKINGESFSVKKLEPIKIQPETQIQNNGMIYPLSTLDHAVTCLMKTVYIFKAQQDGGGDHRYSDVIKKGLARVLVHYYPFSGRLVMKNGKFAVEINGELGVPFVEAVADGEIDEIGDITVPDSQVLGDFVYTIPGVEDIMGMPLLTAQVTEFKCGGFVLGLTVNHCMVDGLAAMEFVNSWAETSREISHLSVHPFLDRSILTLPRTDPSSPEKLSLPPEKFGVELKDISNLKTLYQQEEIEYRSFDFDVNELASLNKSAMEEDEELKNCTSFTILAALLWRIRSRALNMKPHQETRLVVTVNIRSKLRNNDNSLAIPKGYFGNAVVTVECVCMAGELMEKPFSHVVKMVQSAIKMVNEDYIKSYMDFLGGSQGGKSPPTTATMIITSWSRIPFKIADFGWGEPTQFGSVWIPKEVALFCSDHGKEKKTNHIVLVLGLPVSAMNVFQELIKA